MANVKDMFNSMAIEYDDIPDLWYSWLFSRLHYLIANNILRNSPPKRVLDIGCGTGFQSFLYSAVGCKVIGIDIAEGLIEIAKNKRTLFNPEKIELFPINYDYVKRYNQLIYSVIKKNVQKIKYSPPEFYFGDALNIPFDSGEFDHINCCGSTLSFVENHNTALSEIARILKNNGTFFIEVEAKWNLNVLWEILDPIVKGKFGLNTNLREGLRFLIEKPTRNIWINFLFRECKKPINMKLKMYTTFSLKRDLKNYGLKVIKRWSIHSITSLLPSSFLDCLKPSKKLISIFKFLAKLEERLPFYFPGSSLVLYGKKIG